MSKRKALEYLSRIRERLIGEPSIVGPFFGMAFLLSVFTVSGFVFFVFLRPLIVFILDESHPIDTLADPVAWVSPVLYVLLIWSSLRFLTWLTKVRIHTRLFGSTSSAWGRAFARITALLVLATAFSYNIAPSYGYDALETANSIAFWTLLSFAIASSLMFWTRDEELVSFVDAIEKLSHEENQYKDSEEDLTEFMEKAAPRIQTWLLNYKPFGDRISVGRHLSTLFASLEDQEEMDRGRKMMRDLQDQISTGESDLSFFVSIPSELPRTWKRMSELGLSYRPYARKRWHEQVAESHGMIAVLGVLATIVYQIYLILSR